MQVICDEMGIEADESGFLSYVNNIVTKNSFDSEKTLYETYGYGDADWGKKYFEVIYRGNLAFDELRQTAVVTVKEPAEDKSFLQSLFKKSLLILKFIPPVYLRHSLCLHQDFP